MVGAGQVENEYEFLTALESAVICGWMWGKKSHCISPATVFFAWKLIKMTAGMFSDVMSP